MSDIYLHQSRKVVKNAGGSIYGLAFIGALIYFFVGRPKGTGAMA